jgi:hypothetical protein
MVHLVLEFLIILTTIGSWVRMFKKGGDRVLSQRGLESLKYYTSCRVRHHYDSDMGVGGRYAGSQGGISKLKTVVSRKFAIFPEKLEKFPEMW